MKNSLYSKTPLYTLLLSSALSICAFTAKSQSLSFGPKIGYSNTTFVGNDVPNDANTLNNITAGIFFKAAAGEIVSFQPEILYAQRGGTTKPDNEPDGATLAIDYLQVPILIKAQIPVAETVFPFFYAGPYGAFELNNEFTATGFNGVLSFTDDADVNDFDYGVVVGAGIDFQVNSLFIGIDARYDVGMTEVWNFNGNSQDYKNRAFTIFGSLGINL